MSGTDDDELDEGLRLRLRRLALVEQLPSLDHDARDRVVSSALARVEQERRTRNRRAWAVGGGGVLLAAAAAAVLSWRSTAPSQPAAADRRTSSPAAPAVGHGDAPGARGSVVARCARAASVASVAFAGEGDWRRAELGHALVLRGAIDDASIEEASQCRTEVELRHGLVAVRARDLAGGELRVRTDLGTAVVRGTAFSVRRDTSGFAVEVVEGTVEVSPAAGAPVQVHVDERWSSAQPASVQPLAPHARAGLRVLLGLDAPIAAATSTNLEAVAGASSQARVERGASEPGGGASARLATHAPVRDPSPSGQAVPTGIETPPLDADALVRMAEAARRAGDLATARRLYREAGTRRGATAEAAWLALARLELRAGNAARAREAIDQRRQRFGEGRLGAEAAWIAVRAARAAGDEGRARREAEELVRRFPSSPQAGAARQLLDDER